MAILGFFGYALQYAQKINMSVAIVCMVNNTAVMLDKHNKLVLDFNITNYIGKESNSSINVLNECPRKVDHEQSVVSLNYRKIMYLFLKLSTNLRTVNLFTPKQCKVIYYLHIFMDTLALM
jgi:hypothetical protein